MSKLVPREDIERIVGSPREKSNHLARVVSARRTIYILHSQECLDSGIDLRDCPYSVALDKGTSHCHWDMNVPLLITIDEDGRLKPERNDGLKWG